MIFWDFYNFLTVPRTVSNTCAQLVRGKSCANNVQHTERSSRATCRATCHVWYEGTAQLFSLTEFQSHLCQLDPTGWTISWWRSTLHQIYVSLILLAEPSDDEGALPIRFMSAWSYWLNHQMMKEHSPSDLCQLDLTGWTISWWRSTPHQIYVSLILLAEPSADEGALSIRFMSAWSYWLNHQLMKEHSSSNSIITTPYQSTLKETVYETFPAHLKKLFMRHFYILPTRSFNISPRDVQFSTQQILYLLSAASA